MSSFYNMSFKVERSRSSSNVDEKFSDYPPNTNMDALKVKLREFGSMLDLH
jgi:hypothetical protein